MVFNDHPLLIIQASGITEEKIFQALHKWPSFSTGGLLWLHHFSNVSKNFPISFEGTLVTQPMLQPTPNQTELRLMVSKSIFNVDSKNVSEKFLHRHSWKNVFFFKTYLGGPKEKIWKTAIFSGVTVEELFVYIFGIYIKNGFRNHQS